MIVQTPVQAQELNAAGTFGPYHAANGHLMIAPLRDPAPDRETYCVDDTIRYDSWAAWCADNCSACRDGEPLEDW